MTPQTIRFQGLYRVQLQGGFNRGKSLSREALEQFAAEASRQYRTPISIQYETSRADRVSFSKEGNRQASTLGGPIEFAQVDIQSPKRPARTELGSFEDLDLYDQKPARDADEAFDRFIRPTGVHFNKVN
jgi:hypothetical protein